MRVYGFTEKAVGFMEVENSLKAEQHFVGGHIEVLGLTDELDLVCNDEGKICQMEPRAVWIYRGELVEIICGDFFVCRHNDEGEFVSIEDRDEAVIKRFLLAVEVEESDEGKRLVLRKDV
jgi:hypothetical protein